MGRGLAVLEDFLEFSPDATDVRVLTILLTSPRYLFGLASFILERRGTVPGADGHQPQERETLQRQREQLEEMGLSEEEVDRALQPLISFRDQLREKIETYERRRRGDLSAIRDLRGIGRWLIGARIAKGWSLSDLADALDVSVQQVSRDENNEYQGISTVRAQRILDALGVRFRLEVEEPVPPDDNGQEKAPA